MRVTTCLCCVLFIRQIVLIKTAQGCRKLLYQDQCWSASIWVTSSLEIRFSLSLFRGFNTTFATVTKLGRVHMRVYVQVCSNLFLITGFKGQQLSFFWRPLKGHILKSLKMYKILTWQTLTFKDYLCFCSLFLFPLSLQWQHTFSIWLFTYSCDWNSLWCCSSASIHPPL